MIKFPKTAIYPLLSLITGVFPLLGSACGAVGTTVAPQREGSWPEATSTLIWHGSGKAYRSEEGRLERAPQQDYEFTVIQRRYAHHWESTKEMRRLHPEYDGSAGPRAQSLHFSLRYASPEAPAAPEIDFSVSSSLGSGQGGTDAEFRKAQIRIVADGVSRFAPFDTYTIDQNYLYEEGKLRETVMLVDSEAGDAIWVRVDEEANLFARHRFPDAPTRAN